MTVYYNEIDPFAAAWLRELIKAGHIADGVVDERSIEDVCPSDLRGFTQCHFFAGIGVWSYALRRAGWSDDRPVWTGSCPCQPFSAAGKGAAFADERHLWPAFYHLISKCRPAIVLGEQVASKDADAWVDLVQTDLEAVGFAFGAVAFPSAGVGAPHIRDRTYWVADSEGAGKLGVIRDAGGESAVELRTQQEWVKYDCGGWLGGLANSDSSTCGEGRSHVRGWADRGDAQSRPRPCGIGMPVGLADTEHDGCGGSQGRPTEPRGDQQNLGVSDRGHSISQGQPPTGPTNGFWGTADWLFCRDGKWRPVEPGTFPLAHGAAARVGRLRGYGNAITAVAAQAFIESVMEAA